MMLLLLLLLLLLMILLLLLMMLMMMLVLLLGQCYALAFVLRVSRVAGIVCTLAQGSMTRLILAPRDRYTARPDAGVRLGCRNGRFDGGGLINGEVRTVLWAA